jgi:hypothetical protein
MVESSSSSGFASVSKSSVLTTTDHDGKGGAQSSSSNSSLSLARAETRMVFRSKLLVFFVLGLAAIICATSTYIFAKNSEHDVFQKQVRDEQWNRSCQVICRGESFFSPHSSYTISLF